MPIRFTCSATAARGECLDVDRDEVGWLIVVDLVDAVVEQAAVHARGRKRVQHAQREGLHAPLVHEAFTVIQAAERWLDDRDLLRRLGPAEHLLQAADDLANLCVEAQLARNSGLAQSLQCVHAAPEDFAGQRTARQVIGELPAPPSIAGVGQHSDQASNVSVELVIADEHSVSQWPQQLACCAC